MKVIIYGIVNRYDILFDFKEFVSMGIFKNEIQISGFADRNPELWGREILHNGQRFLIHNIDDFSKNEFDKIMVTTDVYFDEIRDKLVQDGYKEEQIFLIDNIFEQYVEQISYDKNPLFDDYWMRLYEDGNEAAAFFRTKKYKRIAVYGADLLAERLMRVLKKAGIKILRNPTEEGADANVLPETDLIVVTTSKDYMKIERELCEKNHIEVISIQELVYKTLNHTEKR